MGLDITAYRNVVRVGDIDEDSYSNLYPNSDFLAQADGLVAGAYKYDEEMGFRAGSYSGYNEWRNELAKLAGHKSAKEAWKSGADGSPFSELINFSDCEGVIGPKTSAKLARDFADFQDKADAQDGPESDWFKSLYGDWRKAFEMAAQSGAVAFH